MKEFRKKEGTTNSGVEYENINIANLVLKLVHSSDVKNFYISANDEKFGSFDDVVVEVELEKGTEIYAFQMKHSERGNLAAVKLTSRKGDFSISKYFESFQTTRNSAQKYILFTNLKLSVEDNTSLQLEGEDFSVGISKFYSEDVFRVSERTDYCYKFHVVENTNFEHSSKIQEYQDFFNCFYLYVNQDNSHQLKLNTSQKFKEMFLSNEAEFSNYLNIIFEWAKQKGVKEMLDKRWMQRAIALQLLSSRIQPIDEGSVHEHMKIMREAISTFDVTTFEEASCEKIKKLWGDVRFEVNDIKEANKLRRKYQLCLRRINNLSDIDGDLLTRLSWLMGKCPLIVKNDPTIQKAMELCFKEKFVLLGEECVNKETENKLIFRRLSDLKTETAVYNKLIRTFFYSLQEKQSCTLEDLALINEECVGNITVDTLLQMLEGPINIGGAKEVLPDPYIPRLLLNSVIDSKYLEKIEENILVIIYCVSTLKDIQNKFSQHNFIDLDDFLNSHDKKKEEKDDQFNKGLKYCSDLIPTSEAIPKQMNVYVSNNDYRADYFPLLCKKIQWKQNCHQFRLREDGNLEWIQSKEDIGELEKFRLLEYYSVKEESLWRSQTSNKINLIISDPGMGKTELLKNFKNKYFDNNVWTVILNPRDAFAFCEISKKTDKIYAFEKYIFEDKYQNLCGFERNVFKMAWQKKRFILVWDALDEIPDHLLSTVIITIKEFEKRSLFQLVTSRSRLRKLLEETFNVLSTSLNQFSESEQLFYIEQRLGDVSSKKEIAEITEKIKKTFALFEHKDILGIPLQIFMLTELFRQNKDKYVELLNHTFALTDIYYHFVDEKFNLHFIKIGAQLQQPFMQTFYNILKSTSLEYYENTALKILFSKEILNQLNVDSKEFSNEIKSGALAIGLITHVDNETPRFLHHSYAEFLAALYFSQNLRFKDIFLTIMFEERYVNVRFFFDLLLAKNSEIHIAVLYKNYDLIQQKDEIHSYKDEGGRNVLHVYCSWGRRYSRLKVEKKEECHFIDDDQNVHLKEDEKYLEVLNYLLAKFQTFENDSLFGLTPLTYAQRSKCFIVILNIIHKQNQNILEMCDEDDAINILYYSAIFGYDSAIDCVHTEKFPLIKTVKDNHSLLHLAVSHKKFLSKLFKTNPYKMLIDTENQKVQTPLFVASQNGNFETADFLVALGAKINCFDSSGSTPLFAAAENAHLEIVKLLVECGADIDLADERGFTPLKIAALKNHLQVVKVLITSGAKVNYTDTSGATALYCASHNGQLEIVKILIESGTEIDLAHENGCTPLNAATFGGHLKVVEVLITFGAKVNHAGRSGITALHRACLNSHLEIVKLLIEYGAEIDLVDANDCTPLKIAALEGHLKVVEVLITSGAKVNFADTSNFTALYCASQNGHLEIVKLLIECGAEIDLANKNGFTPLKIAALGGHLKVVEILITSGAKVNHADTSGFVALYCASQSGHLKIVKLLIECGAEINLANENGFTPLRIAVLEGHLKVVEVLITSGANVNHADTSGFAALYCASQNGHLGIVKLLIECGAEIDVVDTDDTTPLKVATFRGHLKVVEVLIAAGAKVNHASTSGITALYWACQKGHLEIVKFLIECGAQIDLANKNDFTPLKIAAFEGHLKVVEVLITCGVKLNYPDTSGVTALHCASLNGHLEIVKLLIESGAEIDLADENGSTPLKIATLKGHLKVVEVLITSGAKVNHSGATGLTALYCASQNGHFEIVKLLIKSGAKIDLAKENGSTPLKVAALEGHLKVVEILITSGAKVNSADTFGVTALHCASQDGNLEVIKLLIEYGAEIDLTDEDGFTPLNIAAFEGHLKVVEVLITSGAKVNHSGTSGLTALHCASQKGHLEIVKLLIECGAKTDLAQKSGFTPLNIAAYEGNLKVVEVLITSGAKVNYADTSGITALHRACLNGHLEIVKLLVECRAEIDLADKIGCTPLNIAAFAGHLKVVEVLITSGAKINYAPTSGFTALYSASQNGHLEIVKLLSIECGAEINLGDEFGSTPLKIAALKGHLKVVEVLITSGAKVNSADTSGSTALHCASQNGHLEIVKLLIESGAEIDLVNGNGTTPLQTAALEGHLKVVECLIASGATVNHADTSGRT